MSNTVFDLAMRCALADYFYNLTIPLYLRSEIPKKNRRRVSSFWVDAYKAHLQGCYR